MDCYEIIIQDTSIYTGDIIESNQPTLGHMSSDPTTRGDTCICLQKS
jgi:hypothetical protein